MFASLDLRPSVPAVPADDADIPAGPFPSDAALDAVSALLADLPASVREAVLDAAERYGDMRADEARGA